MRFFTTLLIILPSGAFGATRCDSERVAIGSVFFEACQTDTYFCKHFMTFYSQKSSAGNSLASFLHVGLLDGEPQPTTDSMSYQQARRAILSNTLEPNELARFENKSGKTETQRFFGGIRYLDSRVDLYHTANYERMHVFRDENGNLIIREESQVKNLRKIPYKSYGDEVAGYLSQMGVKAGFSFVDAGVSFTVSQVEGKVVDETGEFIFTKVGDKIVKKPLRTLYSRFAQTLPTRAVSATRAFARQGGRLAKVIAKGPLGGALELSVSPTQAACADASVQFVKGMCSDDPKTFHRWFRELGVYDREELLKNDSGACGTVSSFLDGEFQKMQTSKIQQIATFDKQWKPQQLKCGAPTEFRMSGNTLVSQHSNENIYHHYIIDTVTESGSVYNRVTVEPRQIGDDRLVKVPAQYVLRDDIPVWINHDGSETSGPTQRVYEEIESANVDLHRWLVELIAKQCRKQSKDYYNTLELPPEESPGPKISH